MFKIVEKKVLGQDIKLFRIEAPDISKKARPGQFVIVKIGEKGERIPLTINDFDPQKGTITIVFQEVGKTTILLGRLNEGDVIEDLVGPLGKPTEIENFGKVVCVGGGVGTAVIYPVTRGLFQAGNQVIGIIGARNERPAYLRRGDERLLPSSDNHH